MIMPPMFSGRALRVDLSKSEVKEVLLEDSLYRERIGGAAILSTIIGGLECIAFGVGPLTGTPCPAGSAAIACVSTGRGSPKYCPVLLGGGLEFRLSGFDFVIITGRLPEPSYLWIRDMVADIVRFPSDASMDCWQICREIRREQGDPRIQVISCSDTGISASLNFTSGWDGIGLGEMMRRMNLRAVAFRGMADIDIRDASGFLEKSSVMMREFPSSRDGKTGLPSLLDDSLAVVKGLRRTRACFSCPFPCLSYADSGDPSHPQYLVLDQRGLLEYYRQGTSCEAILSDLARDHKKGVRKSVDVKMFDTITDGVPESEMVAVAYILGLCPRYVGLFSPDVGRYCELLEVGLGRQVDKERLIEMARSLSGS